MHELPWITIFGSRVRRFANNFHEWRTKQPVGTQKLYFNQTTSWDTGLSFILQPYSQWRHRGYTPTIQSVGIQKLYFNQTTSGDTKVILQPNNQLRHRGYTSTIQPVRTQSLYLNQTTSGVDICYTSTKHPVGTQVILLPNKKWERQMLCCNQRTNGIKNAFQPNNRYGDRGYTSFKQPAGRHKLQCNQTTNIGT